LDYGTWRPAPNGQGVRFPSSSSLPWPRPGPSTPKQRSYADVLVEQVLTNRGLGRYTDPHLIRTAQLEIAEAYNMTEEQLQSAARSIVQQSPKYFEHLGGQKPSDIKDFNQYSQSALFKPRSVNEDDMPGGMHVFMSAV
ncbi:hypothetical protein M513_06766, partial [Trichuris suis]